MPIERLKYETIHLKDGRNAVLSTARLPSGEYETMLLGQDGDEIVSAKSAGEEEALATFQYFKMVYSAPVLTGRYKKLSEDLKAAFAYGREHQGTDDGGTSNFDAPTLHLRGWSRKMVEAAAAAAGGSCSFWNLCGSYIFPVPGTGQGNTRTAAAEAAGDYLKELGYDTGMYYQMY